jgi:hypothetical protein
MPDAASLILDRPGVRHWLAALEERHLANLSFSEVSRALRALSAWYVQHRDRLTSGVVFDGAGKRAAFALFYGPLHFVTIAEIVERLDADCSPERVLLDLGCGTGVGSAAWALASARPPRITGIELHPWAAAEAGWTWGTLGLTGRALRGDILRVRWPRPPRTILSAFTLNEVPDDVRARTGDRLAEAAAAGDRILIVEPIAGAVTPWWDQWCDRFVRFGVRADTWRFRAELPEIVARLDRAAGLDHRELTARSLYVGASV